MFAMTLERDPLRLADLSSMVETWVQTAGGYAALVLLLFVSGVFGVIALSLLGLDFLAGAFKAVSRARAREEFARYPLWQRALFFLCTFTSFACYIVLFFLRLPQIRQSLTPVTTPGMGTAPPPALPLSDRERLLFTVAGAAALLAIGLPFLRGILALRWRRIYAIASLSFKEAIRLRALYAFSGLILVFLFASWFVPYKPEDQVRTYVQLVYMAMTPLLLFTTAALAGFSIPTDIRQLRIQTIVTKPVERFEVVLGRFLGFMALMTLVLVVLTGVSLLYVFRGIGPDAAAESLKARVPVYGTLYFENAETKYKAESVGREWDYRTYISAPMPGQASRTQYACWGFTPVSGGMVDRTPFEYEVQGDLDDPKFIAKNVPVTVRTARGEQTVRLDVELQGDKARILNTSALPDATPEEKEANEARAKAKVIELANKFKVRCEFTFDIYRTTKGEENKGVFCDFTFLTAPHESGRDLEYGEVRGKLSRRTDRLPDAVLDLVLADRLGYFEVQSKPITDYHTQTIDVPTPIFRAAQKLTIPAGSQEEKDLPLQVRVKCSSRTQYIGMAKYDLYFRLDDPDGGADTALFAMNFFKGAMGLWMRLALVAGVAVAVSTYLTGVISMLLSLLLYLAGTCREFIEQVAFGTNVGGGPTEALLRLVGREHITAPRDETTVQRVAEKSDVAFRWVIRRVLDMIPDVDRFDLTTYVAEGFNISGAQLGLDFLLLVGYLIPWFVLGYFVMKWREIATW